MHRVCDTTPQMSGPLPATLDEKPVRLEVDARSERQIALMRGGLGVLLLVCAAWLFNLPERMPQLVGLFGLVFAVLWLMRGVRALRASARANPAQADFLELDRNGLLLRENGRERRFAWQDVTGVGVDHDRLTIVLTLRSGAEHHIEPRYRGVPLDALRALLEGHWLTAKTSTQTIAQSPDARPDSDG